MYRYDIISANFTLADDYDTAIQNFANWWTYYGNRNRAIIAGMTTSLASINNMRVGYFKINPDSTAAAGESTGSLASRTDVTMRDMGVAADKSALYTSMRRLDSHDTTPTRSATAFMVRQFMRTNTGAPVKLQCQKNAGMLFTDGFSLKYQVSEVSGRGVGLAAVKNVVTAMGGRIELESKLGAGATWRFHFSLATLLDAGSADDGDAPKESADSAHTSSALVS
jgi:hypothetical protein